MSDLIRRLWNWLTGAPPGNPDRYPPTPHDHNMTGLGWAGHKRQYDRH